MSMDKSRTPNEEALDFVSKFNEIYFQTFKFFSLYAASRSWDNFSAQFFCNFGNMSDDDDDDDDDDDNSQDTDDYLMDASPFLLDEEDLICQGFQKPPIPVPTSGNFIARKIA
ncbi:hypothetical protein RhiirB3_461967 [Rhizophagus irregularis]|nr:hypothetical protein RhiirB3_461967 [Rhizophagus irregularis]